MKRFALPNMLLLVSLLAIPSGVINAQSGHDAQAPDALYRTVASLDAAVFDAYNQCDLAKFGTFFADDVEFYHDKGGLTRSRQALVESVKNNICGKVRRELVPGTLEVYPIPGYGAIEIGVHRFYELRAGSSNTKASGEAKFVHIWRDAGGAWVITRVISYAHGAPQD